MKTIRLLAVCILTFVFLGCNQLTDFGKTHYDDVKAPKVVYESVDLNKLLVEMTGDNTITLDGSVTHTFDDALKDKLTISVDEKNVLSARVVSEDSVSGVVTVTLPVMVPYHHGVELENDAGIQPGANTRKDPNAIDSLTFKIIFNGENVSVEKEPQFISRTYYLKDLPSALELDKGTNGDWYKQLTICEHDNSEECPTKDSYTTCTCDCVEECLTKDAAGSNYNSLGDYTEDKKNYIESAGLGNNSTWGGHWALKTCNPGIAEMTIPYGNNKVVIGFKVDEYGRFFWKELREEVK